jgi:hypothetical protein
MHARIGGRPLRALWCPVQLVKPSLLQLLLLLELQLVALPLPLATAVTSRGAALPAVSGQCQDTIKAYCGAQQGNGQACEMCAGLHQHQLRNAGCTHELIVEFCREAQPVAFLGYACTCRDLHKYTSQNCLPLLPSNHATGQQVVVQLNEDDAGRFDPMEDGRVDWNATTTLVRHTAPYHRRPAIALQCTGRPMRLERPELSLIIVRCSK